MEQKTIKYPCEVDFTCLHINALKTLIEYHVKDEDVLKSMFYMLEKIRQGNSDLRDWGHDLRKKLIATENIITSE